MSGKKAAAEIDVDVFQYIFHWFPDFKELIKFCFWLIKTTSNKNDPKLKVENLESSMLPWKEPHHNVTIPSCTTCTNFIIGICWRSCDGSITYPAVKEKLSFSMFFLKKGLYSTSSLIGIDLLHLCNMNHLFHWTL